MNPERIDLNLLRVFDIVYEERNLLRAAGRLNLSQSAVSHALGRLRQALGDELFVRSAAGMQPTARALAIAGPVRSALRQIGSTLGGDGFDPATTSREFVVAASDYLTTLLVPGLLQVMRREAPFANLVVRPATRIDLAGQIDLGKIDLAVGVFAELPPRFRDQPLWTQGDALAMRPGHPLASRQPKVADLLAFPLAAVSLGGEEEGAVDGYIAERGLARQSEMFDRLALQRALAPEPARLSVLAPHALALPALLRDSDMLAILPTVLARSFARDFGLASAALPYPARDVQVRMVWHERSADDPAHAWLRDRLAGACLAP